MGRCKNGLKIYLFEKLATRRKRSVTEMGSMYRKNKNVIKLSFLSMIQPFFLE